jgi:SAM-dependent methyltransferase
MEPSAAMTSKLEGTGSVSSRNGWFARLRKLFWFIRTVDLDQVGEAIAQFDARQRKLEQAQRDIEAVLLEARGKIETVISLAATLQLPDLKTIAISNLDVKNLGYEIGRRLAEENFSDRPIAPNHTLPKSKLCTQNDFATDWFLYWCRELHTAPYYHRKIWELCYVAQALFAAGQLSPGHRGIGFGCGEEPLPSLFAKYGVRVLATDLEAGRPEAEIWRLTDQHASTIETIRRPDICPDQRLLANIEFQPADMNVIPAEFDGQFDFCWSTCALEHLGNLANGLKFVENSLRTLKPGGTAVHTTEFTLNEGETIDNHPIVLYQRQHFLELASRLQAKGYDVAEFDFSPGDGVMDRFVDLPPFSDNVLIAPHHYAHLKLLFDGYTCTSIGIIIRA